jgi:hypothetical protein
MSITSQNFVLRNKIILKFFFHFFLKIEKNNTKDNNKKLILSLDASKPILDAYIHDHLVIHYLHLRMKI